MKITQQQKYLGMKRAVAYSGRSDATLRRAVRKGVLTAFRVGLSDNPRYHRLVFRIADLDQWLQRWPAVSGISSKSAEVTG